MAKLEFKDISFKEMDNKVRVTFLKIFYFDLDKSELKKIADFGVADSSITFKGISDDKARRKLNILLDRGFEELTNKVTNKRTVYIHQNSTIPLIGNVSFGIVDRNSSLIELKPITSCNIDCIYCSVDQNKRLVDFVVEKDYLVKELKKLIEFKGISNIEAHIGTQGEPFLYADIVDLIRDISEIKQVKTISIDTNGTFLTKHLVDKLAEAGLTRFKLSINAVEPKLARKIANCPYDIKKIMDICKYIVKKTGLMITPVLIPGINEAEIEKIIKFAKEIKADLGIQNFLNYKFGKNPVKEASFDKFYEILGNLEKKHNVKLIKSEQDFNIIKTKELPKPFRKGDVIRADIACPGRLKNEKIAVSSNRTISVPNCYKIGSVRLKITRDKHNIFVGTIV